MADNWIQNIRPGIQLAVAITSLILLPPSVISRGEESHPGQVSSDLEGVSYFEKKILPVLTRHCYECHSRKSEEPKGALRVDTRRAIRAGGATGEGIVPGDTEASLVIQAMRYVEDAYAMPPSGKLSDDVIRDFERWVRMGAPDPRDEPADKIR
jgi:hypothetical protein